MGINISFFRFIFENGASKGGDLLTLGRQNIAFTTDDFNDFCKKKGLDIKIEDTGEKQADLYDELVFKAIGYNSVYSMDYSNFEGASFIHDLNSVDLPDNLLNRFDCIIDGGTTEHVFNTKYALENIHKMLKVGGTYMFELPSLQPCFNHGYYNFSPDLFYEYFKSNNYEINRMCLELVYAENKLNKFDDSKSKYYMHLDIGELSLDLNMGVKPVFSGCKEAYVLGAVTKKRDSSCNVTPYQGMYSKMWENLNYSVKQLHEALGSAKEKTVLIYGTGEHTRTLIANLPNPQRNKIMGLLDNKAENIGKTFYMYKVYDLSVADKNKVIIISSDEFQEIIYDRIKHLEAKGVKIVKLYKRS